MTNTLTYDYAQQCFTYHPETGEMFWKHRPKEHFVTERAWKVWNAKYAGKNAGSISKQLGYILTSINNKTYYVHRIVYLLMTKSEPKNEIDHINMIKHDNRWENLREANKSQNNANRVKYKNNKSGHKGVLFVKSMNKFKAEIRKDNKSIHLGYFIDKEDAIRAYQKAADKLFGNYARVS